MIGIIAIALFVIWCFNSNKEKNEQGTTESIDSRGTPDEGSREDYLRAYRNDSHKYDKM